MQLITRLWINFYNSSYWEINTKHTKRKSLHKAIELLEVWIFSPMSSQLICFDIFTNFIDIESSLNDLIRFPVYIQIRNIIAKLF